MSDTLFDEIEQFLADGGEPAEPTPEERMQAAIAAFNEAAKAMVEAMRPMIDAVVKVAEAIREWCAAFVSAFSNALTDWYENVYLPLMDSLRRDQLSAQLESYWVSRPVARWIAARWPKRWLPELVLPPPEIV